MSRIWSRISNEEIYNKGILIKCNKFLVLAQHVKEGHVIVYY